MKKTIIGILLEVASGRGYYVLSVQVGKEQSLVLTVDGEQYSTIFPAGQPLLREIYEFEIEPVNNHIMVTSAFRINSELIPAEDIPQYDALSKYDHIRRDSMDLKGLQEAQEQQLLAIEEDPQLLDDLQKLQDSTTAERKESIKNRLGRVGIEEAFSDSDVVEITNEPKKQPTLAEMARSSRSEL